MIKHFISVLVIVVICAAFAGCDLESSVSTAESPTPTPVNWEEMERVEVSIVELENERYENYKAYYEKYKDKVIVVTGNVYANTLDLGSKLLTIAQEGDKRIRYLDAKFDDDDITEEMVNFKHWTNVVIEGVLVQPKTSYSPRPFKTELEHCKLLESSDYVNSNVIYFDMTPAFNETKYELINKYEFVKNIDFQLNIHGMGDSELIKVSDITFDTEVETGTASKDVIAYANEAARLLNDNAHKLNENIKLSDESHHGGLYTNTHMLIKIYPEGMKGQTNRYYVYDVISNRPDEVIKLSDIYP